jgi:adenylosuccinate lyase
VKACPRQGDPAQPGQGVTPGHVAGLSAAPPVAAELREAAARSLGLRRRFYLLQPELRHRSGR